MLGPRQPHNQSKGEKDPRGARLLTRVRLLGILLALAADDEHEDQKQDEDEAGQGNDHQEPPLLVEGVGLLGWTPQNASGPGHNPPRPSPSLLLDLPEAGDSGVDSGGMGQWLIH